MLIALIRKELRLLRPAIVAALVVALFFDVLLPAISLYGDAQHRRSDALTASRIAPNVATGAVAALFLSCAMAAIFAAAGATTERRERWSDFAAMLPAPRWLQTLVRLAVAATLAAVVFGGHAAIARACNFFWARGAGLHAGDVPGFAAFAFGMFGIAWLAASFLRSPAIASALGIGSVMAGLAIAAGLREFARPAYLTDQDLAFLWLNGLAIVGALAILAGTYVRIRRVSP